jgi:hypothetical protein
VNVKIKKLAKPVGIAAVAVGMAAATVIPASAASNIKPFGQPETLIGPNYEPQITYTVHGLNPSSAAVPHNGQLYEANVTVDGGGIPMMPFFNARAEDGANYRVTGGAVPGTIFFDVVGTVPNSVVYNDGVQDLLVWIPDANAPTPVAAPGGVGESQVIGGSEFGGAEAAVPPAAPAVVPAPEVVNPFETPEQRAAREGGR